MKRSTGPILLSFLTVAAAFAGCSDDPPKGNTPMFPTGGSSGATSGGSPSMAGNQTTGGNSGSNSTAGTETGGTAGTAGTESAGTAGGGTGGTAGNGGTGGMAPMMVDLLVDSVVVRKVGSTFGDEMGEPGAGGAGGAGGDGAAGEPAVGAGGVDAGGAGGAGPDGPRPEVALAFFFDSDLELWDLQSYGSTPNVGIDGGPEKLSRLSTQTWVATGGYGSAGAMRVQVPFSTKDEQLDIHRALMPLDNPYKDYSGYEIVAKVKLLNGGAVGECLGAWIYVTTGNMYRFARGNLAAPLVVDDWAELEFELDDPDPNSTPEGVHVEYDPAQVGQLGIHIQSRACAP